MMKNRKGFTLVELLVAITILGVIMVIAIPLIRNVQGDQTSQKYKAYRSSIEHSARLYVETYGDDEFGNNDDGCILIKISDLIDKDLAKDIQLDDDVSCASDNNFVIVTKNGKRYHYETVLSCGNVDDGKKYEELKESCNSGNKETTTMKLSVNPGSYTGINMKRVTINISAENTNTTGINKNSKMSYAFTKNTKTAPTSGWNNLSLNISGNTLESTILTPENTTGKYYLHLNTKNLSDEQGDNISVGIEGSEGCSKTGNIITCGIYVADNKKPKFNDSAPLTGGDNFSDSKLLFNATDDEYTTDTSLDGSKDKLRLCLELNTGTMKCAKNPNESTGLEINYQPFSTLKDGANAKLYDYLKDQDNNDGLTTATIKIADLAGNVVSKDFSISKLNYEFPNGGEGCTFKYAFNGATWGKLCTPTKENLTFKGWYTSQNGSGNPITANTIAEDNLTVYAVWKKNIADLDITLNPTEYTYDGIAKTPTVTVKDGDVTLTNEKDYTLKYENNVNVGTAKVTITAKDNYNATTELYYEGTAVRTFTIKKRVVSITDPEVVNGQLTYTGSDQNILAKAGSCSAGGTMYWYSSNPTTSTASPAFNKNNGWTTKAPGEYKVKNAGTYNIYYYCYVSDLNNNEGTEINKVKKVSKEISKKNATISLNPASGDLQYGTDGTSKITVTGDGILTCESNNINIATCTINKNTNTLIITPKAVTTGAAQVEITVNISAGSNYNAASAKYLGKVIGNPVTYKATNQTKTYDGMPLNADNTCELISGRLLDGHTPTCTTSGTRTDAGTTPKTLTKVVIKAANGTDVSNNYNITMQNGDLEIKQREVKFRAKDQNKMFDGTTLTADNTCELISGRLLDGHAPTCTTSGSLSSVGTATKYLNSVTIRSNNGINVSNNYKITKENGLLTLTAAADANPGSCADLTYNGSAQTLVTGGSNVTYENNSGTDAKNYAVTIKANPGHTFDGGGTQTQLNCTIKRKKISFPTCETKTYTGNELTLFEAHNGEYKNEAIKGTAVGTYRKTLTPNNNYEWNSGSNPTAGRELGCEIKSSAAAETGSCADLTYNGSAQTLVVGGSHVTYENNSGTDAKTYTVTVKPTSGYSFPGGESQQQLSCSIKKATGSVSLNPSSGDLTGGVAKTSTITVNGSGNLSCASSDTSVATCSINNKTLTVTPVSTTSGQATITVSKAAETNYTAASATYTAIISDNTKPTATLTSTSDLKVTSQTLSAKCEDSGGVVGYYLGTTQPNSTGSNISYTSVTSTTSYTTTSSKSSAGTYYLSCKDSTGNISQTKSVTLYSYTVYNMLLKESTTSTRGSYNTTNYEQKSSATYIAPASTSLTLSSIVTAPSGNNEYIGYSSSNSATSLNTDTSITLSSNKTIYAWYNYYIYSVTKGSNTRYINSINAAETECNNLSGSGTCTIKVLSTSKDTTTTDITISKNSEWNLNGKSIRFTKEPEITINKDFVISSDGTLTFDNLTNEETSTQISVNAGKTLRITGNPTITSENNLLGGYGNLIIDNGTYKGYDAIKMDGGSITINNGAFTGDYYAVFTHSKNGTATITINDGTFKTSVPAKNDFVSAIGISADIANCSSCTTTATINGGNFYSDSGQAIFVEKKCSLKITKGHIEGKRIGIYNRGTLEVGNCSAENQADNSSITFANADVVISGYTDVTESANASVNVFDPPFRPAICNSSGVTERVASATICKGAYLTTSSLYCIVNPGYDEYTENGVTYPECKNEVHLKGGRLYHKLASGQGTAVAGDGVKETIGYWCGKEVNTTFTYTYSNITYTTNRYSYNNGAKCPA